MHRHLITLNRHTKASNASNVVHYCSTTVQFCRLDAYCLFWSYNSDVATWLWHATERRVRTPGFYETRGLVCVTGHVCVSGRWVCSSNWSGSSQDARTRRCVSLAPRSHGWPLGPQRETSSPPMSALSRSWCRSWCARSTGRMGGKVSPATGAVQTVLKSEGHVTKAGASRGLRTGARRGGPNLGTSWRWCDQRCCV